MAERSQRQPKKEQRKPTASRSRGGDSRSGQSRSGQARSGQGGRSGDRSQGGHKRTAEDRRSSDGRQKPRKPGADSGKRDRLRVSGTGGGDLPNWIKEEVARVTQKDKRDTVLGLLGEAADDFANGHYPRAHASLLRAKKLTSRVATIRELLGLTAYRMGNWEEALRELRTYRRIDGDTSHMPVEMDCQRALERDHDVHQTWERYREIGGREGTDAEMRVVYASFLLDHGEGKRAWSIINPGRITDNAKEWDLRRWFVAARVAATLGDEATARQLIRAIEKHELGFPGIEEIHALLDR